MSNLHVRFPWMALLYVVYAALVGFGFAGVYLRLRSAESQKRAARQSVMEVGHPG